MKHILRQLKTIEAHKTILPLMFLGAYFKSILLQTFFEGANAFAPSAFADGKRLFYGLFFGFFALCLLYLPAVFFKSRGKCAYAIAMNAVITLFCLADACYFRAFRDLFSLAVFGMAGNAAKEGFLSFEVISGLLSRFDLLFFADFILMIPLFLFRKLYKDAPCPARGETAEDENRADKPSGGEAREDRGVLRRAAAKLKETFSLRRGKGIGHFFLHSRAGHFILNAALCLAVFLVLPVLHLFGAADEAFADVYTPPSQQDIAFCFTPVGYHAVDAGRTIARAVHSSSAFPKPDFTDGLPSDETLIAEDRSYWVVPTTGKGARDRGILPDCTASAEENAQIDDFYAFRSAHLSSSALSGAYKGKNLLFLQVESLENFVLNHTYDGKPITPFLDSLLAPDAPTISFVNVHDQVKGGNSSDCDLMINTGLLPTSSSGSGIFFRSHLDKIVPTAADLLRQDGYRVMHINGSGAKCAWDYYTAYRDVFGFNTDSASDGCEFFLLQASEEAKIEKYLCDEKIYDFVYRKMLDIDPAKPWYIHTITTSSHMPFTGIYKLPEERLLVVPKDRENHTFAYLNGVHYADEQLRIFLEKAEDAGLLDNTLVVIYGDHTGLHKYYPEDAEATAEAYPDLSFMESEEDPTIAFLIYDPSGKTERQTVTLLGGQIDVTPTVLDLIGMDPDRCGFMMGRSLLSSNADFTVLSNGTVLGGDTLTENEKRIVKRMYKTADMIISSNYASRYLDHTKE